MKAWVLHDVGDFRFETVGKPALAPGEVLVAVGAVGICGSDIPRIYRTGAHVHPLIPGHEFAGVVAETGADVDAVWKGRRVGVFPLIPCGECVPCRRGRYEMCRHYGYLGSRRDGGFSEYVAVPARNLIRLPETVSLEEAAMMEPMAVAVHAMRRMMPAGDVAGGGESCGRGMAVAAGMTGAAATDATASGLTASGMAASDVMASGIMASDARASDILAPDGVVPDTVVVYGLGTIGLLLVMFLLDAGSCDTGHPKRILAVGNKESQRRMCVGLGLSDDCFCDSRVQDAGKWIMEHTGGLGADVFFECVGKNETFARSVDCTAPAGRICLVGNPYGDMMLEREVYWKILRNQLTVTGTWNSSFTHSPEDDWNYVLDRLLQKRIEPGRLISHRYPLKELGRGFGIMRDKTEDYVKIIGSNECG